jgi:dipeptidyl-peptidase-4
MANRFWAKRQPGPRSIHQRLGPQAHFVLPRLDTHLRVSISAFVPCSLLLLLALAAGVSAQQAAPKPLTVERIYTSPSLSGSLTSGIEWAPDSKRISYLDRGPAGSNELWTMDASTGNRKVLVQAETLAAVMQPEKGRTVQSTGLGRIEPDNYLWSPDGRSLLFIGSTSLVSLDLNTMMPKTLVSSESDIEDPKFSPDGKWVSFVRNSNLWIVSAAGGAAKALTTGGSEQILKAKLDWLYPEELDASTAYWWSPDSTRIAYYEMDERPVTQYPIVDMSSPAGAIEYTRFPQAGEPNPIVRVGVVSIAGGTTKWVDTGAEKDVYLARVDWLRDSRRLAVQRLNRAQNKLDLLFCDVTTGASQTILTDTDKYWINIGNDLYFFSDGRRFLWSSERTGFRHYYLYDLSGKLIDQLTSGNWAITGTSGFGPGAASHPAVDESHECIFFLSNKDSVTQTQMYRLSLKDRSIERISREPGTHEVIIAPDDSGFVDRYSNAMTPPRQDLYRSAGARVAAINENNVVELKSYALSPVEFVDLPASDGAKLYAAMIKPPAFDASKKYPVLIDVYGGPQVQMVRDEWGGNNFLWDEMMAQKGFIVFSLDNRGSYNRGHAFETPIYHQFGKVELEDQLSGVNYLKSLPYVDGARIGIWGWSYGGYMTLEALFNAPGVFKAGVSVAPVSDWRLYDTAYTERYMGRPQDNPAQYESSSPVSQANQLRGKLMLVHGTGDDNVHFANTSEVINKLIQTGKYPADVLLFPGRGHPIGDRPARIQLFERVTEFLMNNL